MGSRRGYSQVIGRALRCSPSPPLPPSIHPFSHPLLHPSIFHPLLLHCHRSRNRKSRRGIPASRIVVSLSFQCVSVCNSVCVCVCVCQCVIGRRGEIRIFPAL